MLARTHARGFCRLSCRYAYQKRRRARTDGPPCCARSAPAEGWSIWEAEPSAARFRNQKSPATSTGRFGWRATAALHRRPAEAEGDDSWLLGRRCGSLSRPDTASRRALGQRHHLRRLRTLERRSAIATCTRSEARRGRKGRSLTPPAERRSGCCIPPDPADPLSLDDEQFCGRDQDPALRGKGVLSQRGFADRQTDTPERFAVGHPAPEVQP